MLQLPLITRGLRINKDQSIPMLVEDLFTRRRHVSFYNWYTLYSLHRAAFDREYAWAVTLTRDRFRFLTSRGATAECVFHSLWMLNISYKACLHSNVHNAMCNIWQRYLDLLSMSESALWYWAMLEVKSTMSKLLPVLTHMHTWGTRQITDFFYQSESVPVFYPHSSTQKQQC